MSFFWDWKAVDNINVSVPKKNESYVPKGHTLIKGEIKKVYNGKHGKYVLAGKSGKTKFYLMHINKR